ncbi:MAG: hypothetical protein IKP36_06575 [Bacteroidaceae bacterium]|nr:hypothetical protein [Bacteroidaceae bacterium]
MTNDSIAASGVIVSRKVKGSWWRSNCKLVINEDVLGADLMSLGAAVDKSLAGSQIYTDDDLYLNNSGSGGEQGSDPNLTPSSAPQVSNNVLINGISQDVSGGALSTDSLTTIVVSGSNLTQGSLTIKEVGSSESQAFTVAENGSSATYNAGGIVTNTDKVYEISLGGQLWFSLTIRGSIQGME